MSGDAGALCPPSRPPARPVGRLSELAPVHSVALGSADAAQSHQKAGTMAASVVKPLVIEFVGGIPAAGKTTIARACRALGTSLGYPVHLNIKGLSRAQVIWAFVRAPLLWRCIYGALRAPSLARNSNESFPGHRWRCLMETRLYFATLYAFTRRHPNAVVILDQWMSRKLDVVEDQRRASEVLRFVADSDIYFEKYYIFLNLPIQVLIDRGWQRTWLRKSGESDRWYREEHLDRTKLSSYYVERKASYEQRYSRFAEHGLKVLRLDAERTPEENARLILDRLVQPYVTKARVCGCSDQARHREAPRIHEAQNALE